MNLQLSLYAILILFYLIPSFVAAFRKHRNYISIKLFNLLFGQAFIGRAAALIWSFTDNTDNTINQKQQSNRL